jgi:hypothetical protein
MKPTCENDTITAMMFLVAGFQTPEHVNRMLRFRTSLLHKKKKQEFDQEDQEVLTPAPP